jgi:hypothetical protein
MGPFSYGKGPSRTVWWNGVPSCPRIHFEKHWLMRCVSQGLGGGFIASSDARSTGIVIS